MPPPQNVNKESTKISLCPFENDEKQEFINLKAQEKEITMLLDNYRIKIQYAENNDNESQAVVLR